MRPTWDEYFMEMAKLAATRSPCLNIQVGAIITIDNRVVGSGYNGPPAGVEHCKTCDKATNGHCYKAVHAEVNAILQAARFGIKTEGTTLYTIYSPCIDCAKIIINAGIRRIVFAKEYKDSRADVLQYLLSSNVDLHQLTVYT